MPKSRIGYAAFAFAVAGIAGGSSACGAQPTPASSARPAAAAEDVAFPVPSTSGVGAATSIPDSVMINSGDLPATSVAWKQTDDRTPASGPLLDPDDCDPAPTLPIGASPYPTANGPADLLTRSWLSPTTYALTTETVVTFRTRDAAEADFALHKGWVAECAKHFSWTVVPHVQTITAVELPGVDRAYSLRAAMYAPGGDVGTAGSQGYVYLTVIQRGNALAFLTTTSDSSVVVAGPGDPGAGWTVATARALSSDLAAAYEIGTK